MKEKSVIKVNGFLQNCYRLNTVSNSIVSHSNSSKEYESLERVDFDNGFVEVIQNKEYPINSDSVTSFADGVDYKRDPMQAIANSPQRVNLGDITEAQKFLQNPMNYRRVYEDTCARLQEYFKSQAQVKAPNSSEKIMEDNVND